jgi:hypothetical protein
MTRGRGSAFAAVLALLGCAPKPVPAARLAYPVMAFESHGPVVYPDAKAFCTTTENGQEKYRDLAILDVKGRLYVVTQAMAVNRSTHWIMDLAGNAPVTMDVLLRPDRTLDLPGAKARIVACIDARGHYLDLVEGGRGRVVAELQADPSLDAVFARFAGPRSSEAVLAETQRQADARAGVAPKRTRKPGP